MFNQHKNKKWLFKKQRWEGVKLSGWKKMCVIFLTFDQQNLANNQLYKAFYQDCYRLNCVPCPNLYIKTLSSGALACVSR